MAKKGMHTIKIFLGSSFTELKEERMTIGDYLMNSVRPIFKYDNIELEVVKCEDSCLSKTGKRLQLEIDKCIRECDAFVFLFKSEVGDQLIHEFNKARKIKGKQQRSIFVFFFEVPKAETSKELIGFQNQLIDEGYYWYSCKDVTDLESQLILGLLQLKNQLLKINSSKEIEQKIDLNKDIDELRNRIKTMLGDEKESNTNRKDRINRLYREACRLAEDLNYNKEEQYNLLSDYADFLIEYDLYDEARAVCRRQISIAEELFGLEHEETANSYNNLGSVYWQQGDYKEALKYDEKALAIREKVLGEEHPDTAESYNNIGSVYHKQGDYDLALQYYNKAFGIREKILGVDHPETATSYSNIGEVYDGQGDYKNALKYHNKALKIRKKDFDRDPAKTADSYNNIGLVYLEQGKYGKALNCYHEALNIYKKDPDTKQPDIAETYNNIGKVHYIKGDFDEALKNDSDALNIREAVLGKDHPDTAESYNNIGKVYYATDNYVKALEYYKKALTIRENILGIEHTKTADSYNNIGSVFWQQGDYEQALDYDKKALEIREKVLGEEHPDMAESYNNIGSVYHKQGDFDLALQYHNKALGIREKILGVDHPDTATSYSNIGEVYYDQGEYEKALGYHKKALIIREKILGKEHAKAADSYNNIGLVYYNQGNYSWAREYYKMALERYEKASGKMHSDTKNAKENLAKADIIEKVKDALLISGNSDSIDFFKAGVKELFSSVNCTECSLWFINYNNTHNKNQDDNFISTSLMFREHKNEVNYQFEEEDYVHNTTHRFLDCLINDDVNNNHFLWLDSNSPILYYFVSKELVEEEKLTDFIIIPIYGPKEKASGQQEEISLIAYLELSFTEKKLYSDGNWNNNWKALSTYIRDFFFVAFKRFEFDKEKKIMEDLIRSHGEMGDKGASVLFQNILENVLSKYCPVQGASFFIWDTYGNRYNLVATTGLKEDTGIENVFYFRGEGRTGRIGQTGEPLIIDNLTQEEAGKYNEKLEVDALTEVYLPISDPSDKDSVIGVFRLVNKKNVCNSKYVDHFNDSDIALMSYAAEYLSLIISNLQKEEIQYDFIDKLTHEFTTPANAILNTADRLYTHVRDEEFLSKYLSPYLKNIIDLAERQKWQAKTTLFLSRNRKKQPFEARYSIKPTLLWEVINMGIEIAIPTARKYDVSFQNIGIDKDSDRCLTINIDEDAFVAVFYNLFTNAIKYHDPKNKDGFYIRTSYWINDNNLIITIEDNGMGVKQKDQNKIFEKGFRSESAIRSNASGFGIGLTVIKQVVKDFGGDIKITSLMNPTVFRIDIPMNKIQ